MPPPPSRSPRLMPIAVPEAHLTRPEPIRPTRGAPATTPAARRQINANGPTASIWKNQSTWPRTAKRLIKMSNPIQPPANRPIFQLPPAAAPSPPSIPPAPPTKPPRPTTSTQPPIRSPATSNPIPLAAGRHLDANARLEPRGNPLGWEGWWGAWWVWEVLAQHDVGFQLFGDQPFGRV